MKELSLNILDISQNSVKAGAACIDISITETEDTLEIMIDDDGCGMPREMLENVLDPFCTTRTTRNVGLGLPLFKDAAEQTGGYLEIQSTTAQEDPEYHGTTVTALFHKDSIDFTPLGDIASTIVTCVQGAPDIHWIFTHTMPDKTIELDTDEMKEILGDIPLNNLEVVKWLTDYLLEEYEGEGEDEGDE